MNGFDINKVNLYDFDEENVLKMLQKALVVMNLWYSRFDSKNSYENSIYSIINYVISGDSRYLSSSYNLRCMCVKSKFDKLILNFFKNNNVDFSINNFKNFVNHNFSKKSITERKDIIYIYFNFKNDKMLTIKDACDNGLINNDFSIINYSIAYYLTDYEEKRLKDRYDVRYVFRDGNYKTYSNDVFLGNKKVKIDEKVIIYKNSSSNESFLSYNQALKLGVIDKNFDVRLFINISDNTVMYLKNMFDFELRNISYSNITDECSVNKTIVNKVLNVYVDDNTDDCYLLVDDAINIGLNISKFSLSNDGKFVKLGLGMDIVLSEEYEIKYQNACIYQPKHLCKKI